MEIKQETLNDTGRFYIEKENTTLAEMDYEITQQNLLLITHTEVSESLAGKGTGKQLVSAAVDYAREHSLKIKSVCTFAKSVLDKTPEYADVYSKNKS